MIKSINRIDMSFIRRGVPGWIPAGGFEEFVNDAYFVDDITYFVKRFEKRVGFHIDCIAWNITKCDDDGFCIEEYEVTFRKKRLECTCRAGSKNIICRHIKFVIDAEQQRAKRKKLRNNQI